MDAAAANLGALCGKPGLDPKLEREARKLLDQLRSTKNSTKGSTWSSLMAATSSTKERDAIDEKLRDDPNLQKAKEAMLNMPAPAKVDLGTSERFNFLAMTRTRWTKKKRYFTANELAARKKEKWIRSLHADEPEPYVFDFEDRKGLKRDGQDALLKHEAREVDDEEYRLPESVMTLPRRMRMEFAARSLSGRRRRSETRENHLEDGAPVSFDTRGLDAGTPTTTRSGPLGFTRAFS